MILKGKIAVIEVKSLVGSIYNPPSDTWHQSAKMRDGETKELDFFNPIRQNERHIAALAGILEKAKITPKPKIENLVIFTSSRAVFTYERQKEIYTLPEAIKKLKAMNTGSVPKLYIWWYIGPMRREPRSVIIMEPWKGLASVRDSGSHPK